MDLESRILQLAEAEGLLDGATLAACRERTLPAESPSLCWGPRVDALVDAGQLKEEDAVRLALQADAEAFRSGLHESQITRQIPAEADTRLPEWRMPPGERYEVLQLVGEGGMGRVYRARDKVLDRIVALKFIRAFLPAQFERVLREARNQARLEHPHICRVYEVGEAWGTPYIAMEFLEGQPLHLAAAELGLEAKADLVRVAAEAIHVAHREGLIHRDLKPGNILVTRGEDGSLHPHVVDFGLAVEADAPHLTQTGTAIGTPAYMSPEQAQGRQDLVDRRSDVWSLGVILFELLSGQVPFKGNSVLDLLISVRLDEPSRLQTLRPGLPRDLVTIVETCLQKDPARRYESARALAEDLGRYLDGLPIRARAEGLVAQMARRARKHKVALGVGGIALLLLLGTGTLWLRARWAAAEQVRLAQAFGHEVAEVEASLRYISMLDAHDVSAEEAGLRERITRLQTQIRTLGKTAAGPGHDALGRAALAFGDYDEAQKHAQEAWRLGFRQPSTARVLGQVHAQLYLKVLKEITRNPSPEQREKRRAQAIAEHRDPAKDYLRRCAGAEGEASELLEARIAHLDGQFGHALERCDAALARVSWLWDAPLLASVIHRDRADLATNQGHFDEALSSLDLAESCATKALAIAHSAPRIQEELCSIWSARLAVLLVSGKDVGSRFQGAQDCFRKAQAIIPRNPVPLIMEADAWMTLAQQRVPSGQDPRECVERTIGSARRASLLTPSDTRPFLMETRAWLTLGDWQRSHGGDPRDAYLKAASSIEQALVRWKPARSATFMLQGQIELRLAALEHDRKQDPVPRYLRAIEAFDAAIRIDEGWSAPSVNQAQALGNLGVCLMNRGQDASIHLERAKGILERLLARNPKVSRACNNLGWIHHLKAQWAMTQGQDPVPLLDQAAAWFRKAAELDAKDPLAVDNLGEVELTRAEHFLAIGKDASAPALAAIQHFRHAQEINPRYADASLGLGRSHGYLAWQSLLMEGRTTGQEELALASLAKARQLKPDWCDIRSQAGDIWLLKAREQLAQGRDAGRALARARLEFEAKLAATPDDADAHFRLGELELCQARATLRKDPAPAFAAARVWIQKGQAIHAPHVRGHLLAARLGLWQALWTLEQKGAPAGLIAGVRSHLDALSRAPVLQAEVAVLRRALECLEASSRPEPVQDLRPLREALGANPGLRFEYGPLLARLEGKGIPRRAGDSVPERH